MPDVRSPTPGEAMFFYTIMKHMKNKPDVDWAAVAEESAFKNAEVAKVRFGQVRRKLKIGVFGETTPKNSPEAGVAKTTKRKAIPKKKKEDDDDDEESKEPKPEMVDTGAAVTAQASEDPF